MGTLAVLGLFAPGCGRELYVMSEEHELIGDQRVFAGGGCFSAVQRGIGGSSGVSSGGSGSVDGDFVVQHESDGDGLIVTVRSGDTELARREYHEGFLESGKVDRFQVTTLAGKRFELAYWGGTECDTSHLPRE